MKEQYESVEIELIKFKSQDILTSSTDDHDVGVDDEEAAGA